MQWQSSVWPLVIRLPQFPYTSAVTWSGKTHLGIWWRSFTMSPPTWSMSRVMLTTAMVFPCRHRRKSASAVSIPSIETNQPNFTLTFPSPNSRPPHSGIWYNSRICGWDGRSEMYCSRQAHSKDDVLERSWWSRSGHPRRQLWHVYGEWRWGEF